MASQQNFRTIFKFLANYHPPDLLEVIIGKSYEISQPICWRYFDENKGKYIWFGDSLREAGYSRKIRIETDLDNIKVKGTFCVAIYSTNYSSAIYYKLFRLPVTITPLI